MTTTVVQTRLRDLPATLLIHLEHQAQPDWLLGRRMFRYFTRFYDRYDVPIYPIALCSYPTPRRATPDHHQMRLIERTILDFHYQVVQLNRLDWRAYLQSRNPLAIALMARMHIRSAERWRVKAACLRLLVGAELNGAQRRMIGQFVDLYLPLDTVAERTAFQTEVATFSRPEQEVVMEFITSWEMKGRAEGQRQLVERQLARKLGDLPPELATKIAELPGELLTSLAEALLDFTRLDELHAWLAAHAQISGPGTPSSA
jgi:hypothetical protein